MQEGSRAPGIDLFSRVNRLTSVAWVMVCCLSMLVAGRAWASEAALSVGFDRSAESLPRAEIRVAIATELKREVLPEGEREGEGSEQPERVLVAVDELGQLWLRYWGPRGLVDRRLPMPATREQVPLVISLSVGNLVRQEAFDVLRDLERRPLAPADARGDTAESAEKRRSTPESGTPPTTPAPRDLGPQPAHRRPQRPHPAASRAAGGGSLQNSWGNYLVADLPYLPSVSLACAPDAPDRCYDAQSRRVEFESEGTGVVGGVVPAHGRYVMAYSRALTAELRAALRVGFAFSGGAVKNAAARHDHAALKFLPWLLEARFQYFPVRGAFDGAVRPFAYLAGGVSETVASVKITAPASDNTSSGERVTFIHPIGLLFTGVGGGCSFSLLDQLRLELELSGLLAFPSNGWLIRPGIGLGYDF